MGSSKVLNLVLRNVELEGRKFNKCAECQGLYRADCVFGHPYWEYACPVCHHRGLSREDALADKIKVAYEEADTYADELCIECPMYAKCLTRDVR
jgi:ribosomal protein S27E